MSFRNWLPTRKVAASRPSDTDCCPFAARGRIRGADVGGSEAFCLVMAHETPGDSRVRALPSPYRARTLVSPGVSCREHDGMRLKGRQREGDLACGQSRAWLLTGAGTAVDNRVAGWGRPRGQKIPLPIPSCSDGRQGPVDRKKLRTGCRDLVRYSGRCPHRSHPTRAGHRSRWSAAPGGARPSPPTARGRRWWSCSRPG